jgi:hypothetical protein
MNEEEYRSDQLEKGLVINGLHQVFRHEWIGQIIVPTENSVLVYSQGFWPGG